MSVAGQVIFNSWPLPLGATRPCRRPGPPRRRGPTDRGRRRPGPASAVALTTSVPAIRPLAGSMSRDDVVALHVVAAVAGQREVRVARAGRSDEALCRRGRGAGGRRAGRKATGLSATSRASRRPEPGAAAVWRGRASPPHPIAVTVVEKQQDSDGCRASRRESAHVPSWSHPQLTLVSGDAPCAPRRRLASLRRGVRRSRPGGRR